MSGYKPVKQTPEERIAKLTGRFIPVSGDRAMTRFPAQYNKIVDKVMRSKRFHAKRTVDEWLWYIRWYANGSNAPDRDLAENVYCGLVAMPASASWMEELAVCEFGSGKLPEEVVDARANAV